MNNRPAVVDKPQKYLTMIAAGTSPDVTLDTFYVMAEEGGVEVYSGFYKRAVLPDMISGTEPGGVVSIVDYKWSSGSIGQFRYAELPLGVILEQAVERSKPMQESIFALKPELVGLSLGGLVSLGLGVFALVTQDLGLATVMAGPFIASILGFALLYTGRKRKKQ